MSAIVWVNFLQFQMVTRDLTTKFHLARIFTKIWILGPLGLSVIIVLLSDKRIALFLNRGRYIQICFRDSLSLDHLTSTGLRKVFTSSLETKNHVPWFLSQAAANFVCAADQPQCNSLFLALINLFYLIIIINIVFMFCFEQGYKGF